MIRVLLKLSLLVANSMALVGCASFLQDDAKLPPYTVVYPPDGGIYSFDRSLQFATRLAREVDEDAKLMSIARLAPCGTAGSTASQNVLYEFAVTRPYLSVFNRKLWFEVSLVTEREPMSMVFFARPGQQTLEQPALDFASFMVNYETALEIVRNLGGARYEASGGSCFLRVVLIDNQWLIEYLRDASGVQADKLKFCIDARTGESCARMPDWWLES
jgi:hypothetical protein